MSIARIRNGTGKPPGEQSMGAGDVAGRRVLVLAPSANDARLTSGFLHAAGIAAEVCPDVPAMCAEAREGCASLLLAEEVLAERASAQLVGVLSGQPAWSDIPITIITSGGEAGQTRLRRLEVFGSRGNVSVLERPFRPETLVSTVEVALRARRRQLEVRDLVRELQTGEERLTGILDSISDAFIAVDREWRITYMNPGYQRLVAPGHSRAELLGGNLWDKFPDLAGTEIGRFFERVMAEQTASELEVFHAPLGRWLDVRAFPSSQTLSIYARDISERKRHEAALDDLSRKVREQARVFDTALSNISDFAYTFDRDGRFVYMNKPLLDLWGISFEAAAGRNFFELGYEPELAARMQRQIEMVFETGQPIVDESSHQAANGAEGYYEYIFSPVVEADGSISHVVGSTRVITERKRQAAILQEAKDAAEAANRSKDHFLAVLSHELRTPLTPVLMTASVLEMDPTLSPELRTDMAMIRRNVELETKLIDDLLDLSRITAGKLSLRLQPVDLNEAVRHVCGICQPQIAEKGVRLRVELAEEGGSVRADPARLQQILWNVVKNAAKFTPEGGEIAVSTRPGEGGRMQVRVQDSGVGIAREVLPKIFDAFEQGDERVTREFGGLGLGLAITKALVELHRGKIWAESDGEGRGSVFSVELPAAERESPPVSAPGGHEESGGPLRILVVEDHADTGRMLVKLLGLIGYQVMLATTVSGALEIAEQRTFDLVVSDIGLPDATGYELMRQLRERHGLAGIAMSGYGMEEDIRRSLEAGFSEHLVKPVDFSQLERAVRRMAQAGESCARRA